METSPGDIFPYSREIDSQIISATARALGVSATSAERISRGEYNYVYRVATEHGLVVARVFSYKYWPEDTYGWITGELTRVGVPHAKLLFYTREAQDFPLGFMIMECVEGQPGIDAINEGSLTLEYFHEQLGKIIRKVNSIQLAKYGYINNGLGSNSFWDFRKQKLDDFFRVLPQSSEYSALHEQVVEELGNIFDPLLPQLRPVLTHGDASPDNAIVTPSGDIVLVDWDHALAEVWMMDLAFLTWFGSHLSLQGAREDRRPRIWQSFLKGYGPTGFSEEELQKLERACHIYKACNLMEYYTGLGRPESFASTKERLLLLL